MIINQAFPDGFVSSTWGMLPSYTSRSFPGTKKRYGVNGNSFICAVEFGKRIKQNRYWQEAKAEMRIQNIFLTRDRCIAKVSSKMFYFIKKM
jgi:hypothetical protein